MKVIFKEHAKYYINNVLYKKNEGDEGDLSGDLELAKIFLERKTCVLAEDYKADESNEDQGDDDEETDLDNPDDSDDSQDEGDDEDTDSDNEESDMPSVTSGAEELLAEYDNIDLSAIKNGRISKRELEVYIEEQGLKKKSE